MTDLEPLIAKNPFFEGFAHEHLEVVVGCATNVVFKDGEFIFREKQPANHFYLVRHGKVALQVFAPGSKHITIETIGEGEPIGWSWLIPPYKWHFDARCLGPVRALALDGECLRGKCENDPSFGYQFMFRIAQMTAQRLRASVIQMLDVYGDRN